MHDNKVRLSQDVLEKAEQIAAEWGLKNARAAVEAVFRRYCDDYLYSRPSSTGSFPTLSLVQDRSPRTYGGLAQPAQEMTPSRAKPCEALDALDQLLAL